MYVSILTFLADNNGCYVGDMAAALTKTGNSAELGSYITNLVNKYRMVEKRLPVFSDSKSRNARYYLADKRAATAHSSQALAKFREHVEAFLKSTEGKRLTGWSTEMVLFSPVFEGEHRRALEEKGFVCRELRSFAQFFGR